MTYFERVRAYTDPKRDAAYWQACDAFDKKQKRPAGFAAIEARHVEALEQQNAAVQKKAEGEKELELAQLKILEADLTMKHAQARIDHIRQAAGAMSAEFRQISAMDIEYWDRVTETFKRWDGKGQYPPPPHHSQLEGASPSKEAEDRSTLQQDPQDKISKMSAENLASKVVLVKREEKRDSPIATSTTIEIVDLTTPPPSPTQSSLPKQQTEPLMPPVSTITSSTNARRTQYWIVQRVREHIKRMYETPASFRRLMGAKNAGLMAETIVQLFVQGVFVYIVRLRRNLPDDPEADLAILWKTSASRGSAKMSEMAVLV